MSWENGIDPEIGSSQTNVDTQDVQPRLVAEEDYKNLQSEFTRKNQLLIDTQVRLAETNPKEILSISDKGLQDKVIERIYWFKNINELKAVMWDNFYESQWDVEQNDIDSIKKKLSLLEYRSESEKVDFEIKNFKSENKKIFEDNPNAEAELRENLQLLSKDIPIEERIKKAWLLSFWKNYVDSSTSAYQKLSQANVSWWNSVSPWKETISENQKSNSEYIKKLFGNNK